MTELTVALLRKLRKKCQKLAIPKTDDGKYYIFDEKARKEYNNKIKQEEENGQKNTAD